MSFRFVNRLMDGEEALIKPRLRSTTHKYLHIRQQLVSGPLKDPLDEPQYFWPMAWRDDAIVELWLLGNSMKDISKWSGRKLTEVAKLIGAHTRPKLSTHAAAQFIIQTRRAAKTKRRTS